MVEAMRRFRRFCGLVVCLALVSGCVERRMTVISDPPGAQVYVNNRPIGNSPAYLPSQRFIYYGNYDILLIKEGYEPLLVKQAVPPPWYEWPGVDFFSENLVPWNIKDERIFPYQLQPHRIVTPEDVLHNADSFRSRGQLIGEMYAAPPAVETLQKPPRPLDDK
jgi:hypothetical protein